jgi:hypothetical protein
MIMAKKAEMAQTSANLKAAQAQQQQGQAGTIMEQLMAKNAAADAARAQPAIQEQTDVGIASNPIPEMRRAGGGIVAFAAGGDTMSSYGFNFDDSGMVPSIPNSNLSDEEKLDYLRKIGRFGLAQAKDLQEGRVTLNELYNKAYTPSSMTSAPAKPKVNPLAPAPAPAPASALAVNPNAPAANPNTPAPKKLSIEDAQKGILDDYKKLYAEDKETSKKARDEAKYMRMLEAGLNIMGGESPYAFANIGKGAAAASKGYAEDIKGLRAEDRDRAKQLALLGIKEKEMGLEGRKLDITEQRFKEMSDIERQKIGVLAQGNIDQKMATGVNNIFAQLMKKYDAMLSDGSVTEEDLYRRAQEMYKTTTGKDMKGGPAAMTNTGISYNSFMGKK